MENTLFRLNESKFYLNHIELSKETHPDFDYYINAYLSSARSVIWIMKKEYDKIAGWQHWYDNLNADKEQELLKNITLLRNRSQKITPIKVKEYTIIKNDNYYCDVEEKLKKFVGKKINLSITPLENLNDATYYEDAHSFSISGNVTTTISIDDFKDKDLLDILVLYDKWLTMIVNECTEIFG